MSYLMLIICSTIYANNIEQNCSDYCENYTTGSNVGYVIGDKGNCGCVGFRTIDKQIENQDDILDHNQLDYEYQHNYNSISSGEDIQERLDFKREEERTNEKTTLY